LANIAMLFTLTVMLVSIRLSRAASIVTTVVGVLAFDFLFVPPRYSFFISDPQYVVTLIVMTLVGLIAGYLTGGLRYQAALAAQRESRTRSLYDFARALSSALMLEQVFETAEAYVVSQLGAHVQILLPDAEGVLGRGEGDAPFTSETTTTSAARLDHSTDTATLSLAQWCYQHARPAGAGTDTHPDSDTLVLPLIAPMCVRGVMLLKLPSREWLLVPEQRKQLDTFCALVAIAIERIHYVAVAQDALVRIESERLRNALLAALSHDLRTPLTSLVGLSESLALSKPALSTLQHELAASLRDEAQRMANLVANLLEMARIQSGAVSLNLQWQTVEEVVGTALRANRGQLGRHVVKTELDGALPLVRFDAVLIERVLCNLLENAVKYTPIGARITIAARTDDQSLQLDVSDDGPGIAAGQEEIIFDKFTRGERESAKPGVGLGLSICRAIVEAHGGTIRALATAQGALFRVALPLSTPPLPPLADDAEVQTATLISTAS
ncbi:MAG: DUF4118 domain-containing protein, partial [Pseudomonadota bacterium]|nr:DUF4118 domain-containing protein [Pseudomonadota bacterium]